MTADQVVQAFARCRLLLPAETKAVRYSEDWREHIAFMCSQGPEYVHCRPEKVMRWLGFVQGVLWAHGLAPLESFKSMNR